VEPSRRLSGLRLPPRPARGNSWRESGPTFPLVSRHSLGSTLGALCVSPSNLESIHSSQKHRQTPPNTLIIFNTPNATPFNEPLTVRHPAIHAPQRPFQSLSPIFQQWRCVPCRHRVLSRPSSTCCLRPNAAIFLSTPTKSCRSFIARTSGAIARLWSRIFLTVSSSAESRATFPFRFFFESRCTDWPELRFAS
jgi:hypothetical protein